MLKTSITLIPNNYTKQLKNNSLSEQIKSNSIDFKQNNPFHKNSMIYKSNFLPFTGKPLGVDTTEVKELSATTNFDLPGYELSDTYLIHNKAYETVAKKSLIELGSKNLVMIEYDDESVLPQLFVDNLHLLIKNGKGKNIGLPAEKTVLYSLDINENLLNGKRIIDTMSNIERDYKKEGKTPVFIIKGFHNFLKTKKNKRTILDNERFKNFNIVALAKTDTEILNGMSDEFEDYYRGTEHAAQGTLFGLTENETRHLLNNKDFQAKYITSGEDINISREAINQVIRETRDVGSEYPGEAIDLLLETIINRKIKAGSRPVKNITDKDVRNTNRFMTGIDEFPNYEEKLATSTTTTSKTGHERSGIFDIYRKVKTSFKDVGGMQNIKRQLKEEFIDLAQNPNIKKKDIPSGILLDGPPGTGKTLLAQAIAGESGLPIILAPSEMTKSYVGTGVENVQKLYALAEKEADKHPSKTALIFIDEIDGGASTRTNDSNKTNETLNALLAETDGVKTKEREARGIKVVTIGATNRKDMLDSAILRPGRLELQYKIDNPKFSLKARKEIIAIHAANKPFETKEEKQELLENLAITSRNFSGAEISDVLKRAYRMTLKSERTDKYIRKEDIEEAKLQVQSGIKTESEDPAHELIKTMQHECGHGICTKFMLDAYKDALPHKKPTLDIDIITNEGRSDFAGAMYPKPTDNNRYSFESLIARLVVSYGGLSTERALYGSNVDGVSGDLENITKTTKLGILKCGLGPKTGALGISSDDKLMLELYKDEIKQDIQLMTGLGKMISDKVVEFNRGFLDFYKEQLVHGNKVEERNISGDEFKTMHKKWLEDNNKLEEYEELGKEITDAIEKARTSGELPKLK